jgi:hypothetical protein
MEEPMSVKSKVLAATAAALSIVGGASVAGTLSANAATPQCGPKCIEVFSPRFGMPTEPNFIESVRHGVAEVGQPAILGRASSSNPAGDLMPIVLGSGTVADFYAVGMVSAAVNSHFGTLHALQLEYAPSGKATGLCSGVAATAFENEGLSLQPCTTPGTTVFIIDPAVAPAAEAGYFAIINASTTDFARPFVMTYTHEPPARIRLDHLQLSQNGTAPITQLWGRTFGVVS